MAGIRILARICDFNTKECKGYNVIDTNTSRTVIYTSDSIRMYLQAGNSLDNAEYNARTNQLEGTDGSLDKLPVQFYNKGKLGINPKDNMLVAVLEKHLYKAPQRVSEKEYLVNFKILKSNGEILFIGENDIANLIINAGLRFTNARVLDGLNGRRTIVPLRGKFKEIYHT